MIDFQVSANNSRHSLCSCLMYRPLGDVVKYDDKGNYSNCMEDVWEIKGKESLV